MIITDRIGAIQSPSIQFGETTGYSQAEAIGANPRILKSGQTSREQYQHLWQIITNGGEWHGEFHNRRKDGALYWESATIAPIRDEQGIITHFVAIGKTSPAQENRGSATCQRAEIPQRVRDRRRRPVPGGHSGRTHPVGQSSSLQTVRLYPKRISEHARYRSIRHHQRRCRGVRRLTSKRLTDQPHRRKDGSVFPADLFVRHFLYKGRKITVAAIRDMTPQASGTQDPSPEPFLRRP